MTAREAVSERELQALLAAADQAFDRRGRAEILLAADAGLRASGIVALCVGDVADGRIRVRSGKGGLERYVPLLTERLRAALTALPERETGKAPARRAER